MNRRQFLLAAAVAVPSPALVRAAVAAAPADPGRRLRVGVIGHTGRGDYGHGLHTMWLNLPETEVVAVADPDPKGLAAAIAKLGGPAKLGGVPGFAEYQRMLAEAKPDLVAVCPRQPAEHRDMVLAAVAAGAKGIYVEKPFCRTPAEADDMVAACERAGVRLAVAHRNRFNPAVDTVARMVADGAIGRLLEVRGRGKEDARGGVVDLWVLGSHVLNLAVLFAGPPTACSAVLAQGGRPATPADVRDGPEGLGPVAGDAVHARYDTAGGVPIYFDSVKDAGVQAAGFGLQLVGTTGLIDLRIDVTPVAHLVPGNPFRPAVDPRPWVPVSSAGPGRPEPIPDLRAAVAGHLTAARELIAAIRESRQPLCGPADGRLTVEMACAALASHVRGGARVEWPLTTRTNPLAGWA
jgi:predicted dehydrogenase